MSLFSAEANPPRPADLAGVLCGAGTAELFGKGTAGRLSVPVDQRWRLSALRAEFAARGVTSANDGDKRLRTPFRTDLATLAASWCEGAHKSVPDQFRLDGAALRLWALAAGAETERGYRLTLDPEAPQTHEPLAAALRELGVGSRPVHQQDGNPALLVQGRRRLERFRELIGALSPNR
ncbi:hypothetical protein [Sciscionella sediminilitoris]|uniref:hypothetical protein n=1 Tax=Sciscionella sediminilitoris TaxID=1445613 RepID=UPI0004DF5009|nr:hypothetical protein [Sciscionella sp. SE31]